MFKIVFLTIFVAICVHSYGPADQDYGIKAGVVQLQSIQRKVTSGIILYQLPVSNTNIRDSQAAIGLRGLDLNFERQRLDFIRKSLEIRLIKNNQDLKLELIVEQGMVGWNIQTSYIIIDKMISLNILALESFKIKQKTFVQPTKDDKMLISYQNKFPAQNNLKLEKNDEQMALIFLRGFHFQNNTRETTEIEFNLVVDKLTPKYISLESSFKNIRQSYITLVVFNKTGLLRQQILVNQIQTYSILLSNELLDTQVQLLTNYQPSYCNSSCENTTPLQWKKTRISFTKKQCPFGQVWVANLRQCVSSKQSTDELYDEIIDGNARKLSDTCVIETVTCPSSLANALTCTTNKNCKTVISTCAPGYYTATSLATTCTKCPTSLTNCIICGLKYGTTTPICNTCITSYIPLNGYCVACPLGCSTCTTILVSSVTTISCINCLATFTLQTSGSVKSCGCKSNQYLSLATPPICVTCAVECLTCTALACTSCVDGFYLQSPSCLPCLPVCQTCLDYTSCLTCASTSFKIVSGVCTCPSPLFFDINTKLCQTCSYIRNNCQTCAYTSAYNASSPPSVECISAPNYYYLVNGTASACMPFCINCDPSNTACNTCDTNFTYSAVDTACQCTIGLYFSVANQGCLSCWQAIVGCSTCITLGIPNATQCSLCNPSGYFNSSAYPVLLCGACPILCTTCLDLLTCTNCVNNLTIISGACGCTGAFYLNPINNFCQPCDQVVNNCQTCLSDSTGASVTCQLCNDNYYASTTSLTCYPCAPECKTCSTATTCILCADGYSLAANNTCYCGGTCLACKTNTLDNNCADCTGATCNSCDPSYYLNFGGVCANCADYNALCEECDATGCLTCFAPFYWTSTQCSCNNTAGQFLTINGSNTCMPCSSIILNCVTCNYNGGSTQCLTATSGFFVDGSSINCPACQAPCKTCSGSANNCQSCLVTYSMMLPNTCACNDTMQYFFNSATGGCSPCSTLIPNCQTCQNDTTNITVCTTCLNGYFWNTTGSSCSLCPTQCTACLNLTFCTSCSNNFKLSELIGWTVAGACVCNNNTTPISYLQTVSGTCQSCAYIYPGCSNCTAVGSSVNCDACINSTYRVNNTCVNCPSQCATCDATGCLTCPLGTTLSSSGSCQCTSTQCIACNTQSLNCLNCSFVSGLITSCNVCLPGYYVSNTQCLSCPATCVTCTSISSCVTCLPTYVVSLSGLCACPTSIGYYPSNGVCLLCQDIIYACVKCQLSPTTVCSSCAAGYFVSGGGICQPCSKSCLTCSVSATNCNSCSSGQTLNANGTCTCSSSACLACGVVSPACTTCVYTIFGNFSQCQTCQQGYYVNGINCSPCPLSCIDCGLGGSCTTCASTFEAINGSCSCNPSKSMYESGGVCVKCNVLYGNCQNCSYNLSSALNVSCTLCVYKYFLQNDTCVPSICPDGYVTSGELCDDNNSISGDGCDAFCQTEQFFICSGTPSKCLLHLDLNINVASIITDTANCNRLTINFAITPIYPGFSNANFRSMLSFIDQTNLHYISWSYNSGIVSYYFSYTDKLNNRVSNFYFAPSKLGLNQTKKLPLIVVVVTFLPSNNVAILYYTSDECSTKANLQGLSNVVQYASYATLILSALPCKIVGLELFGVLQLAHLSIGNMDYVNTMLTPIMGMTGVNGLTLKLDDHEKTAQSRLLQTTTTVTPSRIESIGYVSNFLRNCNLMFFLVVTIILVSFVLFLCTYICKKCAPCLYSISKRIFKEVLLTLILFNCYNFSFSAGLHFHYALTDDPLYTSGTIAACCAVILPIFMAILLMKTQEQGFGQYKEKFKVGILQKSYFVITIIYRTGMGFYVATMNEDQLSALIVLAISILFLLYNLVNLPYAKAYHNYRANICHLTQFVCLFVTLYYRSMTSSIDYTFVAKYFNAAYLEIGCICLSLIVSMLVLFYEIYIFIVGCRSNKTKSKIDENELRQLDDQKHNESKFITDFNLEQHEDKNYISTGNIEY